MGYEHNISNGPMLVNRKLSSSKQNILLEPPPTEFGFTT